MNTYQRIALFIILLTSTVLGHATKSAAYFNGLYGAPKKEGDPTSTPIWIETNRWTIPGNFALRRYESGKLRVDAIFQKPSMELITVTYFLPHEWTDEQMAAALKPYGNDWSKITRPLNVRGAIGWFSSRNGLTATVALNSMQIVTPRGKKVLEAHLASKKSKTEEVPKF